MDLEASQVLESKGVLGIVGQKPLDILFVVTRTNKIS